MSDLNRSALLEQLNSLANEDDTVALQAARDAVNMVSSAGLTWDDILAPEYDPESEDNEVGAPEIDLSSLPDDEAELVAVLLARDDLNEDTRDDLESFKEDIANGKFEPEDRKYLKALLGRLSA